MKFKIVRGHEVMVGRRDSGGPEIIPEHLMLDSHLVVDRIRNYVRVVTWCPESYLLNNHHYPNNSGTWIDIGDDSLDVAQRHAIDHTIDFLYPDADIYLLDEEIENPSGSITYAEWITPEPKKEE